MLKRSLCLILSMLLLLGCLAACGNKEAAPSAADNGGSSAAASAGPDGGASPTPSPTPARSAKAARITAESGLRVRSSPSTDSDGNILFLAPNNSLLPLLMETPQDGWYEVEYEGKSAYISAEYAKVVEISLEQYNQLRAGSESGASSGSDDPQAQNREADDDPGALSAGSADPNATPKPADGTEDGE